MAQLGDDPDPYATPVQQAPTEEDPTAKVGAIADEWRNWMQEPGNRSSLMQFGIQLMQPIGLGQTVAGHFGQALGAAGEAGDRVTAQELAERKVTREEKTADSQAQLRGSQAETAAHRADSYRLGQEAAAVRAEAAKQRAAHSVALTEAKVRETNEKVRRLQIEADREPDLAKKRALENELITARTENTRAQAEHRQKQTEQADAILDIRRQDSATRQAGQQATERQGDRRLDQGDTRLDIMRMGAEDRKRHWATMDENKKQELYETAKLLGGKNVPSRAQWEKENFGTGGTAAPTGTKPPAVTAKPTTAGPNAAQIDYLIANPATASQFDAKFGAGASSRYLKED